MPNRSTIPALALAALSLSACGASSSSSSSPAAPSLGAFKTGFARDKAQFSKLGNDLGVAVLGAAKKSNSQLESEFSALAGRTDQQQAALRKLNPPAQYKAKLDELIADFGPVAKEMKAIAAAAGSGNAAAARSSATGLVKDSAALKTVDVALSTALGIPPTK
jgi:hypothetical protein